MKQLIQVNWKSIVRGGLAVAALLLAGKAQAQTYSSCGNTDPGGNASQSGLYAEYYAGYFKEEPAFFSTNTPNPRRIDAQINFPNTGTWGNIAPASNSTTNPTNFSVRERGEVLIDVAGDYTFYLTSDDGSYLWIDGDASQRVPAISNATINNGGGHGSKLVQQTVTLAAGWHNLQLLYGDNGGGNNLKLEYSGAGLAKQVIPSGKLCTGIRQAPTSLTYSPNSQTTSYQTSVSSATPTLNNSNSTTATYALSGSQVAGISINASTGVLTADNTVQPGTYGLSVTVTNDVGSTTFSNVYTFVVTAQCNGLDPYNQSAQAGLLAEYFPGYFNDQTAYFINNTAFALGTVQNPVKVQRVENSPSYTLDGSWQASGLTLQSSGVASNSDAQPTQFSARYRGKVYISTAGDYTFSVTSDDAAYLVIDGTAAAQTQPSGYTVNNGGGHSATTVNSAATTLAVGWHDLVLLYGNGGGSSYLSLQYSGPGIATQSIPNGLLCTGIVSAPAGLAYSSGSTTYASGGTGTSGAPAKVYAANGTVTGYAIGNSSSLPAGITINAATGVLSGDNTVAPGAYAVTVNVTNSTSYGNNTSAFARVFTFNVLTPGCTGNDPGGNAAQAGLYGEYFAGYYNSAGGADTDASLATFNSKTPKLKAIASNLNYTAIDSWQGSGLNLYTAGAAGNSDNQPTNFSARYRGRLYIATAGAYTFSLNSDDGSYFFIDAPAQNNTPTIATATINNGGAHGSNTVTSAAVTLSQGLHDILILYGNNNGGGNLILRYAGPSGSGISDQVIPNSVLCSSVTNQPLPVQLTRFEAQATAAAVALSWETASELNSSRFEVQRSADGVSFVEVGRVAAVGSSAQLHQYQHLDRAPLPGVSYYRLRQVDQDGSVQFSPVVTVRRATASAPLLALAPNPTATGLLTAELRQATAEAATLQVLDALGRVVLRQQLPAATEQQLPLDLHALPAGVYLVRVVSATGTATQRLVRQ